MMEIGISLAKAVIDLDKLCVKCKAYIAMPEGLEFGRCLKTPKLDYLRVSGDFYKPENYEYAVINRRDYDPVRTCGPNALDFEPVEIQVTIEHTTTVEPSSFKKWFSF